MKIKIINLNIWVGGILMDDILSFLKKEDADVVLMQEVFDSRDPSLKPQYRSISIFEEVLGYKYSKFAPSFIEIIDGQKILQGQAILSKFPLLEVSNVFYDRPFVERINERDAFSDTPRSLQHVTADVGGVELHLLNTQGIWGEDGNDTPRRLNMGDIIIKELQGKKPLVVAGDFNINATTQTIANIEKHVKNIFKNELKTSFNLKRKDIEKFPGFSRSVVDMMFVSDDISVLSSSCPDVDISDHMPLIAELEVG